MTIMMGKDGQQPPLPQVAIVPPPSDDAPLLSPPWSQLAAARLSRPAIPNIIVDPVPVRDAFGHSRTPPFVPSPSQWAPPQYYFSSALGHKSRAHSDSSIVSSSSRDPYPRPPASALGLPMRTEQSVFSFDIPPRDSLTVPGMQSFCPSVPMETDRPPSAEKMTEEEAQTGSKPNVQFSWHFQSKDGHEKSPKTYWLRRHSDSNLPHEKVGSPPAGCGLTVQGTRSHHDLRGKSEGDTPLPSPLLPPRDSPEHEPSSSPKHEGLVSNRLKVKKYLQKRYLMGLKRLRQSSADADDVFSDRGPDTPSPGMLKARQTFDFDKDTVSPARPESQTAVKEKPPAIKTEPISPCDSEGEGELFETHVFTSSSQLLPSGLKSNSVDSPHWQPSSSLFQFMGPRSKEKIEDHPHPSASIRSSSRDPLPPFTSMLQRGPHPPFSPYAAGPAFSQGPPWAMGPSSPIPPPHVSSGGGGGGKGEASKIIYCPFSEKVEEQRHQRDPTFMCPVCGQVFPSYKYLANHQVNHLPSEVVSKGPGDSNKIYLCKVCNRAFSRSDMLTRHMRLHTGLRPYECHVCRQVFSRSDHLHTHLRTHTGEKPYRCPQCPYRAPRRDMITRHMRIHMKQHRSSRGRRSSSVSSGDAEAQAAADVKRRNQSLSSVESQDSTESLFRRGSIASEASGAWSSAESGAERHWSATSMDSTESYPSPHVAVSPRGQSQLLFSFQTEDKGPPATLWGGSIEESMEQVSPGSSLDIHTSFQKCKVTSDKDSSCSSSSDPAMTPPAAQPPPPPPPPSGSS